MRKHIKKSMLEILKSGYEIHNEVVTKVKKYDKAKALNLLIDYQEMIMEIADIIEGSEGNCHSVIKALEGHCEKIYEMYNFIEGVNELNISNEIKHKLDRSLKRLEDQIKKEVKIKLEIVFCPYKVSMWDSLESIWEEADKDENCDVYVVPLPYYSRNKDMSLGQYHCEMSGYPDYVNIVDYEKYEFEKRHPDIIYIHNPFDGYNTVTYVDSKFHSDQLKKYTDCLVYVPYYISGIHTDKEAIKNSITPGYINSDYIVLPSYKQKEYLVSVGIQKNKFKVMGSPKFDYVIKKLKDVTIPEKWIERSNGKKVFLLNSTISIMLKNKNWIKNLLSLLSKFENKKNTILIWRPHPLLKDSIRSMRPDILEDYEKIEDKVKNNGGNFIFDTNPTIYPSIKLSDALISTYSSIIMQYLVTGKPLLLLTGKADEKNDVTVFFDYFSSYFVRDGVTVENFIEMIHRGLDEKKSERLQKIKDSIANLDGTCGINVHKEFAKISFNS